MQVGYVRPENVGATWPHIREYVRQVIPFTGGRKVEIKFLQELMLGEAHLWVAYDEEKIWGFCTTRFTDYDSTRLLSGDLLAGENFVEWMRPLNDALVFFAKGNGCDGIELTGRLGWERMLKGLGWKKSFSTVELRWDFEDGQVEAAGSTDEPNSNANIDPV